MKLPVAFIVVDFSVGVGYEAFSSVVDLLVASCATPNYKFGFFLFRHF